MNDKKAKRKSESALRTIGEVSEELNLPTHVLRFWESKFSELKPQKRRGGHRYYRPQDVETLQEIKHLLYDQGFTIKGAQKYFKDRRSGEQQGAAAGNSTANIAPFQLGQQGSTPTEKHSSTELDINKLLSELTEIRQLLS